MILDPRDNGHTNTNKILTCPDCSRDTIEQIEDYGHIYNQFLLGKAGSAAEHKAYTDRYGKFDFTEPHFICHHCFDEWWNEEWDEEGGKYWSHVQGLAPLSQMSWRNIKNLKDPGVTKLCNYPEKCYCGECPNPDQLQFDLRHASYDDDYDEEDEDDEDDSTFEGRLGRCFQLSGRRAAWGADPGATLIHGTIKNFGLLPLAHGWVEHSNGNIHEPITDELYPKEIFHAIFNPVEEKRYNRDELMEKLREHQHWGPWHETKGRI
jgi:hypothetical protein